MSNIRYNTYTESVDNGVHKYHFTTVECGSVEIFGIKADGCGETTVIDILGADLFKIQRGTHLQIAAPYLSVEDRERLISGLCGKCWDKIFDPDKEE